MIWLLFWLQRVTLVGWYMLPGRGGPSMPYLANSFLSLATQPPPRGEGVGTLRAIFRPDYLHTRHGVTTGVRLSMHRTVARSYEASKVSLDRRELSFRYVFYLLGNHILSHMATLGDWHLLRDGECNCE
jgi:hypothetical protein